MSQSSIFDHFSPRSRMKEPEAPFSPTRTGTGVGSRTGGTASARFKAHFKSQPKSSQVSATSQNEGNAEAGPSRRFKDDDANDKGRKEGQTAQRKRMTSPEYDSDDDFALDRIALSQMPSKVNASLKDKRDRRVLGSSDEEEEEGGVRKAAGDESGRSPRKMVQMQYASEPEEEEEIEVLRTVRERLSRKPIPPAIIVPPRSSSSSRPLRSASARASAAAPPSTASGQAASRKAAPNAKPSKSVPTSARSATSSGYIVSVELPPLSAEQKARYSPFVEPEQVAGPVGIPGTGTTAEKQGLSRLGSGQSTRKGEPGTGAGQTGHAAIDEEGEASPAEAVADHASGLEGGEDGIEEQSRGESSAGTPGSGATHEQPAIPRSTSVSQEVTTRNPAQKRPDHLRNDRNGSSGFEAEPIAASPRPAATAERGRRLKAERISPVPQADEDRIIYHSDKERNPSRSATPPPVNSKTTERSASSGAKRVASGSQANAVGNSTGRPLKRARRESASASDAGIEALSTDSDSYAAATHNDAKTGGAKKVRVDALKSRQTVMNKASGRGGPSREAGHVSSSKGKGNSVAERRREASLSSSPSSSSAAPARGASHTEKAHRQPGEYRKNGRRTARDPDDTPSSGSDSSSNSAPRRAKPGTSGKGNGAPRKAASHKGTSKGKAKPGPSQKKAKKVHDPDSSGSNSASTDSEEDMVAEIELEEAERFKTETRLRRKKKETPAQRSMRKLRARRLGIIEVTSSSSSDATSSDTDDPAAMAGLPDSGDESDYVKARSQRVDKRRAEVIAEERAARQRRLKAQEIERERMRAARQGGTAANRTSFNQKGRAGDGHAHGTSSRRAIEVATDEDDTDDFIEDDGGVVPDHLLPHQFSLNSTQSPEYKYKVVFHYLLLLVMGGPKTLPLRGELKEYLMPNVYDLRRRLGGLRDGSVRSQIWKTDFVRTLERYPDFDTTELDFAEPGCDACHISSRMSTKRVQMGGYPYDRDTHEPLDSSDSDSDSDDSDDSEAWKKKRPPNYLLGKFCHRRAQVYHALSHWEDDLFERIKRYYHDLLRALDRPVPDDSEASSSSSDSSSSSSSGSDSERGSAPRKKRGSQINKGKGRGKSQGKKKDDSDDSDESREERKERLEARRARTAERVKRLKKGQLVKKGKEGDVNEVMAWMDARGYPKTTFLIMENLMKTATQLEHDKSRDD